MQNKLLYFVALLGAFCPAVRAQYVNNVRVFSDFPNSRFRVDGVMYTGAATFLWPQGSKHFIDQVELQDSGAEWGAIYEYFGWADNLGGGGRGPVTADAGLTWVKVNFQKKYKLTVAVSPECPLGAPCGAPGRVESPCGVVVNQTVSCFVQAGALGRFAAYPGTGAIFSRWISARNLAPQLPTTYIVTLPIIEPTTITAVFMPAVNATATITVRTDPEELRVVVDGALFTPPVSFEWGWDTVHTIGAEPAQHSRGVSYAFHSWSDGGPINHEVRVPSPSQPINLVARFVPAHTVTFQTSPPNLKLHIDGRQDWMNYGFGWLPGSVHKVSAPSTQTDAQGRRYRFVSWSNGQPASFDYTAGDPAGDLRLVATYQLLGQATITSNPAGLAVEVDGASCATPCKVERDAGASITVSAPKSLASGEQSRLTFKGWLDGGSDKRVIELSADSRTYTASYAAQNRLSIAAAPAEGAAIVADPSSPDGFYDVGALVTLIAKPALGFRIRSWSGDLAGSASAATVSVDAPRSVLLLLDRVPAIAPLGVRNAAQAAVSRAIAPGSLISIFGASLAGNLEVGPSDPLTQTLQGVTVTVDDMFLPLIFVSPQQINAQMVSSIAPGTHSLVIRVHGRPETSAQIEVARNAPGLFSMDWDGVSFGVFVRANGQAVTREMPAQPGETLSLLATGLGSYRQTPPDGFLVGESSAYSTADPVDVIAGGERVMPLYAGRASAGVGVDIVRFTVPPNAMASGFMPVQIVVNGSESNVVLLPFGQ